MNNRIQMLREVISRVTKILVGKQILVTQEGVQPFVKADPITGRPKRVNLPYLADDASDELCAAVQGFLDHEVGHCLFTDFGEVRKAVALNCKTMLNIVEDFRVERMMGERFRGCVSNLNVTGNFFLKRHVTPDYQKAKHAGDSNTTAAILMVPLIRAMGGQRVYKDYMADKMSDVAQIYDKIKDLEPALEAARSTKEALALAIEITNCLKLPDDDGRGDGDESESSSGGSSKSNKKGESQPKKSGQSKGQGEGDPDQGESDEPDESDNVPQPESPSGTPSPKGESNGEKTIGELMSKAQIVSTESSPIWEAIDKENANGTDKELAKIIAQSATNSMRSASYKVFSRDYDRVEPLHVGRGYDDSMWRSIRDSAEHMVAPLQKDLERAISARTRTSWSPGHASGRLHSASLARVPAGSENVFRRRHETTSKDVAVTLLVDCSGSMGGGKIHTATQAAYVLSATLERIGIKHEVLAFTTGILPEAAKNLLNAAEHEIGHYSRSEPLVIPIIKGFEERINHDVRTRFGWLPNSKILRNNVDGECLEIAAYRLLARREEGKVLMVLSDGNPAGGNGEDLRRHLVATVKQIEKSGVSVFGIGIQSNAVESFYPKRAVIQKVSDLPTVVMTALKSLLIK